MKKIIASALAFILIVSAMTGCVYDSVTENGNRFFKDIIRGIEYEYDYNWTIEGEESRDSFFSIKPANGKQDGELYCNTVYFMDGVQDEAAEFEKFKTDIVTEYGNAEFISETQGVNENGHQYREIIYNYTDEYQNVYTHCDRIILINKLMLYASGRSKAENYESLRPSYDLFFDSVTAYKK